ncbi:MAG TPA: SMP-30/gluconolactonase/LRE family protein [Actinomycetota bacterium]|nr:SMP-30/gluconolactonase/LRE family protein [Actinomycetota bacterium]
MGRPVLALATFVLATCTQAPITEPAPSRVTTWPPASVAASPDGALAVGSLHNAAVSVVPPGRDAPVNVTSGAVPGSTRFLLPSGMRYAEDGTLFLVDTAGRGVRAARPGGSVEGVPLAGPDGEELELLYPTGLAVAADGTLWVADTTAHRVVRIDPEGAASVAVGSSEPSPEPSFAGDGGPADEALLAYPGALALGPDESLYIADTGNRRIRRVLPDGTIETVAGNGRRRFAGDGGPATETAIGTPRGMAVDSAGTLYFTAGHRLRSVSSDGTISTVAGTDVRGCAGDGGPAADARLSLPMGVAVGPDDTVYVADHQNHIVRAVTLRGTIVTAVALGDPPSQACL